MERERDFDSDLELELEPEEEELEEEELDDEYFRDLLLECFLRLSYSVSTFRRRSSWKSETGVFGGPFATWGTPASCIRDFSPMAQLPTGPALVARLRTTAALGLAGNLHPDLLAVEFCSIFITHCLLSLLMGFEVLRSAMLYNECVILDHAHVVDALITAEEIPQLFLSG